jgi:hypothetical protein
VCYWFVFYISDVMAAAHWTGHNIRYVSLLIACVSLFSVNISWWKMTR